MTLRFWFLMAVVMGISDCSWGQTTSWPTPLPYKICKLERIWVADKDTIRQRAVLDSLSTLLAGRWLLVEEGAGGCFVPAHAPIRHTEMDVNKQGEGIAYVAGKQETAFQLLLSFYWGNARFVMNEQRSKPYFGFFPSAQDKNAGRYYRPKTDPAYAYRNILKVCEETLVLYGPRTGLSYVFRRLPMAPMNNPQVFSGCMPNQTHFFHSILAIVINVQYF